MGLRTTLSDDSAALSGLSGIDRSRLCVETNDGDVQWSDAPVVDDAARTEAADATDTTDTLDTADDHGQQYAEGTATVATTHEMLTPGGQFCSPVGYLAEQVFDDGSLDCARPLGWSHAVRLHATASLDAHDALSSVDVAEE